MSSKIERIDKLYAKIIDLMVERSRAARYKNWDAEETLDKQIIALEEQIKMIRRGKSDD
jgi:hypothetical protein